MQVRKNNKPNLKFYRKQLRKNMPAPEVILWQKIRNNQIGAKFRRQFSVGNYILDFYAPKIKLGIEIDGESHFFDKEKQVKDNIRDEFLNKQGIKVLRFLNTEIMTNLKGCLTKILEIIPPLPPPISPQAKQGEKLGGSSIFAGFAGRKQGEKFLE